MNSKKGNSFERTLFRVKRYQVIFISRWYYQMPRRTNDGLNVSPILLVNMQSVVHRFFLPENSYLNIQYSIPGKFKKRWSFHQNGWSIHQKIFQHTGLLGFSRHPSPRTHARWGFVSRQGKVREIPENSCEFSLTSTQLTELEIWWIMHPPKWTESNNSVQILLITVRSTRHPSPQT